MASRGHAPACKINGLAPDGGMILPGRIDGSREQGAVGGAGNDDKRHGD